MKSNKKILINNIEINIAFNNQQDYFSLNDMILANEGDFFISNWLRNRNTLEYIGTWESLYNPDFNYVEFDIIKKQAGLNSFRLSAKEWKEKTNGISLIAKTGRYGGTYAQKDIAFHFGMWISPVFQLYLIKEYQRLKEIENNQYNIEWNVKRILSKTNYIIHTDAIKNYILPSLSIDKQKEALIYAEEADLLNLSLFGCTAKHWRDANPTINDSKINIRDIASINELTILSNIENINSELIRNKVDKFDRFSRLKEIVKYQREILEKNDILKTLKKEELTKELEK
jgi:hypothetical protein